MNAVGNAPTKYKTSVIKGFLYRAKTLCSDRADMMLEIKRTKQILVNNGYSNSAIDKEIKTFLQNMNKERSRNQESGTTHTVYYRNFMNNQYKKGKEVLKEILHENVTFKNKDDKLKLIVYYKSTKTSNLVMKNNLAKKPRELMKTNVIYDYRCIKGGCEHLPDRNATYTGLTTCTMSRRLAHHQQDGAIQ